MNSIFTRRSVRSFTEKQIEADAMDKILRAAMQAPSAGNQQPWEFVVVSGKQNLEKLSAFNPYAKCLAGANAGIVVLGNTERMAMPDFWQQDLAAATQNILLQAAELGLGAVWFGCAPHENMMDFVRKTCGLDAKLNPFCVIALGYPKDADANKFADRYDESRISYIK